MQVLTSRKKLNERYVELKLKNKVRVSTLSMSNVNLELSLEVMIKLTYYHRVSNNIKNIISIFFGKEKKQVDNRR